MKAADIVKQTEQSANRVMLRYSLEKLMAEQRHYCMGLR